MNKKEVSRQMQELAAAAGPLLNATAVVLQPVLAAFSASATRAAERICTVLESFSVACGRLPRRHAANKPCAWCNRKTARPATHLVKFREAVTFDDDYAEGVTTWAAGRRIRMCAFHANIASRYSGATAYRFRTLR